MDLHATNHPTALKALLLTAVLLAPGLAGAGLEEERIRDAGPKDGQAGDLDPWEVDGVTAASAPGPGGGDSDEVVREGCDCETEQCTQAPAAVPVAGAAGLILLRRRRGRRRRP